MDTLTADSAREIVGLIPDIRPLACVCKWWYGIYETTPDSQVHHLLHAGGPDNRVAAAIISPQKLLYLFNFAELYLAGNAKELSYVIPPRSITKLTSQLREYPTISQPVHDPTGALAKWVMSGTNALAVILLGDLFVKHRHYELLRTPGTIGRSNISICLRAAVDTGDMLTVHLVFMHASTNTRYGEYLAIACKNKNTALITYFSMRGGYSYFDRENMVDICTAAMKSLHVLRALGPAFLLYFRDIIKTQTGKSKIRQWLSE